LAWTWPTEVELLRDLVAIPSVSGTEAAIGEFVERWAAARGLHVARRDDGVLVTLEGAKPGPVLACVSHLDTVPAGEGWTRPPFEPVIEGTQLYGRGSGDAKASVASMLAAAAVLVARRDQLRGRLVLLLGYGEETKQTSMPVLAARAGRIDAAVVGEPTNLEAAVAQRGLMMAELVARGDQRHAGYAGDGGFTNSITALARDLVRLEGLLNERVHPVLGTTTVTATMLEAGISRNVTPPTSKAILDIRSTPAWTHQEVGAALKSRLSCEVVITSERLVPCETPAGSRLLEVARKVRPQLQTFGSPTCSDWVFVRDTDAIKLGPGTSRRSHTADEYVDLAEVTAAREFYASLASEYLK
jgi:acetylornithine deacetylase